MKHKHADVLIAIAEGKDVQWMNPVIGIWHDAKFRPHTPITSPDFEWRIKPETKPDIVKYIGLNEFGIKQWEKIESDFYIIDHWSNQLKLTFDGETGKLISAEVL